jgi:glycogen debranching enzyme
MTVSALPGGLNDLQRKALERLRANLRSGRDPFYGLDFSYVRPSPGRYEFMWSWDACFHAIALAKLDNEMARNELRLLLASQRADGFIGHVIYWGRWGGFYSALFQQGRPGELRRRHSAMVQPPMLAQAIEAVHEASPDPAFLAAMLPKAQRYYDWVGMERDFDGSGLIFVISPWETGLDNSPAFDEPLGLKSPGRLRYLLRLRALDWDNLLCGRGFNSRAVLWRDRFVVVDPLVNAVYADGLRTLGRLYAAAGDSVLAREAESRAHRVEAAVNGECWDPARGHWVHLWRRARRPVSVLTAASIMPLIMEGTPRERVAEVVSRHLTNPAEFWTHTPVPSVAASEPAFDAEGERLIWRGPTSLNLNWFFVRGLRRHGFNAEAEHIAARSRAAVEQSYFREFYSPLTGRGMRGTNFGWATVAVAM